MIDASLLARTLRKSVRLMKTTCATLIPLSLFGCGQSGVEHLRIKYLEESVSAFYESKNLTEDLRVRTILAGEVLEGFCVLSSYEDRVTPDSDKVIAVNAFLERHKLVGQEEYWYLIVKTADGLRLAKFNTAKIPLISPRPAYEGKNCVATRSIIFSKKSVSVRGAPLPPLLGGGPNTIIVINVQPGD